LIGNRRVSAGVAVLAFLAATSATDADATTPYGRRLPPLTTPWTRSVSSTLPLPQYPRPQLERTQWLNLNGRWQFQAAAPGEAPPFGRNLAHTILVPFPVQSPLSGIEREDQRGFYRRTFTVPASWGSQHVLLNFGAVSWSARVYVNGRLAGTHRGDYATFSLDITKLLNPDTGKQVRPNELVVAYDDPIGAADEPVGKQVPGKPTGFFHTASSGIWQTVWLEPVSATHVTDLALTPDLGHSSLIVTPQLAGPSPRVRITAEALAGGRVVATATVRPGRSLSLHIPQPRLWSPSSPYLYGLRLQLTEPDRTVGKKGGQTVVERGTTVLDQVSSYFGMRSITLGRVGGATRLLLNGKFVFESGALDQGYWPDGLYTAPTDAALQFDIRAAKRLGYNMLREHVKVQSDRWYYWADRLGILVWQDMPNMPIAAHKPPTAAGKAEFRRELTEVVVQHRSDPSIVTWIPFNEGWDQFDIDAITRQVEALDPSSLVDTDSGSANCCNAIQAPHSDFLDTHSYVGPFALPADDRASVIGEYSAVLPYTPAAHRWPGVLTSVGSPVLRWSAATVAGVLREQYLELAQEMRTDGLSAAVFTELACYEQELGILSYDRRIYTLPPGLLKGLNESLIDASGQPSELLPQPAAIPPGTSALWTFDEGQGSTAADSSGHGLTLTLEGGASWTAGLHGSALSISAPGQFAQATGPFLSTGGSFTVSAWLNSSASGQSGTAVSEGGPDGSSFSLGLDTTGQGLQSLSGLVGRRKTLSPGVASWWTFVVPATSSCPSASCGVRANLRYDDGRFQAAIAGWHQVTGVYDAGTQTTSVYVDGFPADVEHVDAIPAGRSAFLVGAGIDDYEPTDTFLGAIDQVRTYARALTPAEVWQLYGAERG
jgi:hypothetical protein